MKSIFLLIIFTVVKTSEVIDEKYGPRPVFDINFGRTVGTNVCYNPKAYGFVQRAGTNLYYLISDILLNWFEGEMYCQKFGAHLPSVSNKEDNDYLRWLVGPLALEKHISHDSSRQDIGGYHLGGYISIPSYKWKWTDGKPFIYTNWSPLITPAVNSTNSVGYFLLLDVYDIKSLKYDGWGPGAKARDRILVCQLDCS